MRSAKLSRNTAETQIALTLNLDGSGRFTGTTGIGFLDHMLNLFCCHGHFDLALTMQGDLEVDTHHSVEDLAIVLGDALNEAVGDKKGIHRYGCFYCPMDEALTRIVLDLSGRPYLVYQVPLHVERIGTFETQMLKEFLYAFAVHGRMNLHVTTLYGENDHHIVESIFKGLGHALEEALRIEGDQVLSTKGVL